MLSGGGPTACHVCPPARPGSSPASRAGAGEATSGDVHWSLARRSLPGSPCSRPRRDGGCGDRNTSQGAALSRLDIDDGTWKELTMRVLVAGGSGVIGRGVVSALVAHGHQVSATTTDTAKLGLLQRLGAEGRVMDGLDPLSVGEVVAAAKPDVIVNQMTGLSGRHAGKASPRRPDRFFAATNRLRAEGIEHLLAAATATGVPRVVTQGHGSFNGAREGGWVKTEDDPLEMTEGTTALAHLERVVTEAGGVALRYGAFYGSGANDEQIALVRRRLLPIVGGGTGYTSWVHVDDAASAAVLAVEQDCTRSEE